MDSFVKFEGFEKHAYLTVLGPRNIHNLVCYPMTHCMENKVAVCAWDGKVFRQKTR